MPVFRFGLHFFFLFVLQATFNPYLPLLLRAKGYSSTQIGLLQGWFDFAALAGPLVLCQFADRMGLRRTTMMAAVVVAMLAMLPLDMTSTFWQTAALLAVLGLSYRAIIPLADALACSELPDTARQYGPVRAMGTAGFIAAMAAIRFFGAVDEASSASILRAVMVGGGLFLLTVFQLPDHHRRAAPGAHMDHWKDFDGSFRLWLAAIFLSRLGMAAHYTFLLLYAHDVLQLKQTAWLWAIGAGAELPLIFFAGVFLRRYRLTSLFIVSSASITVRLLIYALCPNVWAIAAAQVLHALSFGLFHCASIEFINRKVKPAARGMAMALYLTFGLGLPGMVGSALGGYMIKYQGYPIMFMEMAVMPLVSILMLLAWRRRIDVPPRQA